MRIIIIGAGEVGYQLTRYLAAEDLDVVVIDRDTVKLQRISEELDVATIGGDGCSPSVLAEAGARKADILIAATNSDEVNMIACLLAKATFDIPRKIARIRNTEYINNAELMGPAHLDISPAISPEHEVGRAIVRLLEAPFAMDVEDFEGGSIKVIGFKVPLNSPITGKPLKTIPELMPGKRFLIGLIERHGEVIIPSGDDKIHPDDVIYMPVKKWEIGDAVRFLGTSGKPAKRIMIIGGGRIGHFIASEMEGRADVKIIDHGAERCKYLSQNLSRAIVLHGDGSDEKLLEEENIADMDAFVAVSNSEELNIMASVLAQRMGARKTITIVNRTDYLHLARGLGLQTVLSPRIITASSIIKYVRRGDILSLTALVEDQAEIIEARVTADSNLVGKSLMSARLPRYALVGAIIRNNAIIIPSGSDVIEAEDKVIIFTLRESIKDVERLLT